MKKRVFSYSACAVVVLFSFALIENKAQVNLLETFSVDNVEATTKNLLRPLAYQAGLLEKPVVVKRNDFIDRDRLFAKTVAADGHLSMVEVKDGSLLHYFNEGSGLLVEGDRDAILERFNGATTDKRIVFNRADADFPVNLLKMLASVVKHGVVDNASPYEESLGILRNRSLSMTCGSVSVFAQRLLSNIGVNSRVVTTLTLEEWNTYDNGHTFLEVYLPKSKKWVAVDLDTKVFYSTSKIARASLLDIMSAGVDDLSFSSFLDVPSVDYSSFKQYQTIVDFAFLNKKAWYGRVFQAFALYDDTTGKYVFAANDETMAKRISSYSSDYTTLPKDAFVKHFYGAGAE